MDGLYHDVVFKIFNYRHICSCIEKCNLGSCFVDANELSTIGELKNYMA